MADIVQETAYSFLRGIAAFHQADEAALRRLIATAELRYYPDGSAIEELTGIGSFAYAIERGGLLVRDPPEDHADDELFGPGELLTLDATGENGDVPPTLCAVGDTVLYAFPSAELHGLITPRLGHGPDQGSDSEHESFSAFDRSLLAAASTIGSSEALCCTEQSSIRDAARAMTDRRVGSIVVVDAGGRGVGIVTDTDLRRRVVAEGRPGTDPVSAIMSSPLITLNHDQPLFEALQTMLSAHLHHLVVLREGRPAGMISSHDLLIMEAQSPLALARNVDRQTDAAGLAAAIHHSQRLIPELARQGMRAGRIAQITSEINDRIVRRAVQLVARELGAAPVDYAWIALGSEGRREQTFKTDQDNAIVYGDPDSKIAAEAQRYFEELGRRVVVLLIEAGFPACKGKYTADNSRWVKPLSGWQTQFGAWLSLPEPESVLSALIFFDFRPVCGAVTLADELRQDVVKRAARSRRFLTQLAAVATDVGPPLGFLDRFVVERGGAHAREIDLKHRGTGPFVDLGRFLALAHGITATNTLERLEALRVRGAVPNQTAADLAQAFESLLALRVGRQSEQFQAGEALSNHVAPESLSSLERVTLREAFKVLRSAQGYLRTEYRVERIAG